MRWAWALQTEQMARIPFSMTRLTSMLLLLFPLLGLGLCNSTGMGQVWVQGSVLSAGSAVPAGGCYHHPWPWGLPAPQTNRPLHRGAGL